MRLPAELATFAVAIVVEVGLRVTTLPRLAAFLGVPLAIDGDPQSTAPEPIGDPGPVVLPPEARRRIRATRVVMRHWPLGDTCLRQALVSGQRIRRLGPRLQVGVAKLGGEVRAHAWLTIGNTVIDPMRAADAYLPLGTPPTEARP